MFQLPTEARLRAWRDFRASLDDMPLDLALQSLVKFWGRAPFVPYKLDSNDSQSWPNPWQLIEENSYCDLAKCLGIVYTILLTKHRQNIDIEIRVYKDPASQYEYNLSWIDQGKYILNLIDGEVVNNTQFDNTLQLVKIYSADDLHLDNY